MKKSTIWIIIAVVVVVIAGVFFFTKNKDTDAEKPEESVSEEVSSEGSSASEADEESSEAAAEVKLDYNAVDISDWMKSEGDTDEVTAKLISIDTVPYGTAGSSLQMASAGKNMLDLSNTENAMDSLKAYLSSMTEIQKDFFSFQWENVYKSASSILADPENSKALLSDAGIEDFDASLYTAELLEKLYNDGLNLLNEEGITNEWKNFTDLEPFSMSEIQ